VLASEKTDLEHLKTKNARLEGEVKRYKERQAIENEASANPLQHAACFLTSYAIQIAFLELAEPFIRYIEARAEYTRTKAVQRAAGAALKEAQEKNKPLVELQG
jgi:hypothetical protein